MNASDPYPASLAAPSSAEIENLGIIFIGFVAAVILYGLTFFQAYIYFSRFPKDSYYLRLTVATLCLIDTASSALISEVVYYYLITQFMVQIDTIYATATLVVELLLSTILAFIVHLFYVSRVYAVSGRSRVLTLLIASFAFLAFVFGITMTVQIFQQRNLADLALLHERVIVLIAQASASAADALICCAMVYYVRPARFPDMLVSESVFEAAVTLFASRGLGFTIFQIGYLAVFAAMPSKAVWIPIQLVTSKLYINTVLALLNAREARHGLGIYEEESGATTTTTTPARAAFAGAAPPGPSTIRFAGLSSKDSTHDSRHHETMMEGSSGEAESVSKYEDEPERHLRPRPRSRSQSDLHRRSMHTPMSTETDREAEMEAEREPAEEGETMASMGMEVERRASGRSRRIRGDEEEGVEASGIQSFHHAPPTPSRRSISTGESAREKSRSRSQDML